MCPPVIRRLGALVLGLALLGSLAVSQALAASITVNSLADVAANDGACTLREAITAANTDTPSGAAVGECAAGSGTDTITFSVAGTITLTSALPDMTTNMSISGGNAMTISGASSFRVFNITAGAVTLSGLTISDGTATDGGGIENAGTLTIDGSIFTGNTASTGIGGGAILSSGLLTVMNSTFSGNTAGNGGAIFSTANLTVADSTFNGNSARSGGAIVTGGTANLSNSTFSGNTATVLGGAVTSASAGPLTITNSTISGNTALVGGGIDAVNGATESMVNTIVAGNSATAGPEVAGTIETTTTSIIGVPGGKTLADILVAGGPVNNGGPTKTIALALVAGNPAIDAGTASACSSSPVNSLDQRGMPRPSLCDIGAYEAQGPTMGAHANVSVAVSPPAPTVVTYTKPTATDEQGGVLAVTCVPPSGSTFAVGTTAVTCTATDAVGHTGTRSFNVIVSAIAAPSPPAPTPIPSLPNSATISRTSGASGATWFPAFFLLLVLFSLATLRRTNGRTRRESGSPK